jgi:uncharacterized protein (TIGR02099 family)
LSDSRSPARRRWFRRRLRTLRRGFWKSVAILIIVSAALVSLGRLLVPYADYARPLVERTLSRALEQPVRIREIRARWPRMSPEIGLLGLEIGPTEAPLLQLDQARLQVRLYNLARPARNTLGLTALGLDVAVVQDESGRWSWQLEQGRIERGWERILTAGDLTLRDAGVHIVPRVLPTLSFEVPEAALARDGNRLAISLLARPPADAGAQRPTPIHVGLRLDLVDGRLRRLSGHAEGQDLRIDVDPSGESGVRTSGEAWVEWREDAGLEGWVDLELARVDGAEDVERVVVEAVLRGRDDEVQLGFDVIDGSGGDAWIEGAGVGFEGRHYGLAADFIDLDRLQPWLRPWRGRGLPWPQDLSGQLHDLALGLGGDGRLHALRGRLENLQIDLEAPVLAFGAEQLVLGLAGDEALVEPSGALTLDWPALMPEPLRFDRSQGRLGLRGSMIRFDGLTVSDGLRTVQADGRVWTRPGWTDAPVLDLVVDTPELSSDDPKRWLPYRGLPPQSRRWLERALIGVERVEAVTTIFGVPAHWKRGMPTGALNSRICFQGLTLEYAPGWPRADDVSGTLEFRDLNMTGTVESGRVAGVALEAPRVRIAHLPSAEIELDLASAPATGAAGLATLTRALPLPGARDALSASEWGGAATATAAVWLPVRQLRDWRLVGSVAFDDSSLTWNRPLYRIDALRGEIGFSREGFGPATLIADRRGASLPVNVSARFAPQFDLRLTGRWPLDSALPDAGVGIDRERWAAALDRVSGTAALDVRVTAPSERADTRPGAIEVRSDLVGLSLDLPVPLNKAAGAAWPFEWTRPLGGERPLQRADLQGRAELLWQPPGRFALGLGDADARLPTDQGFRIEGGLPALDLTGWLGLAAPLLTEDLSAGSGTVDGSLSLDVAQTRIGRSGLGAVRFDLAREGGFWRLSADGEALAGRVRLPGGGAGIPAIVAEFERLHWPRGPTVDEPPGPPSRLDPRRLPEIDLRIDDLRFGDLDLGRLEANSHASADGLEIEQFSTESSSMALTGQGSWQMDASGAPSASGRFRFTADRLGQVLTDAGYDLELERGQAVVTLDGRWPGSPLDFTLQRFEGGMDLVIGDGVIPAARPGAGRLLGLVSLNSIPRRLRLDFTDVFAEGLTFDRVAGHFDLADGQAMTRDLVIEAPAAVVQVRGLTDLVARTYDQRLIVQPGVGSTLPIIGALTGGPIGAAAGAALQQLLDKPLRGISEVQYAVTGPWSDPVLVPVSARGVETLPGEESAPEGGEGG